MPIYRAPQLAALPDLSVSQVVGSFAVVSNTINTGRALNTASIAADTAFTFSGTPPTDTWFSLEVRNSSGSAVRVTYPTSYSVARQDGSSTFMMLPAGGRTRLFWRWDGSGYTIYGDLPAVSNFTASAAPTSGANNLAQGYATGSFWYDSVANRLYVCESSTTTSATWTLIGAPGGIDDLSDVTITSPSTGQVLTYNGTVWANAAATGGGAGAITYAAASTGQALRSLSSAATVPSYALGQNAIDIQASRSGTANSAGAKGADDVVIGNQSGNSGTLVTTGNVAIKGNYSGPGGQNVVIGGRRESITGATSGDLTVCANGGGVMSSRGGNIVLSAGGATAGSAGPRPAGSVFIGGSFDITGDVNCDVTDCALVGPANIADGSATSYTSVTMLGGAGVLLNTTGAVETVAVVGANVTLTYQGNVFARMGATGAYIDCAGTDGTRRPFVRLGAQEVGDGTGKVTTIHTGAVADEGFAVIASSASVSIADDTPVAVITGTVQAPITFPPNPRNGQRLVIAYDAAATFGSYLPNGSGRTIRNAPTGALAAGTSTEFIYSSAGNTWYRLR